MQNRKIIIFSGAGLSAESGTSTFKDSNGLWEKQR
jgi:NAD-dependent deacetylase